MNETVNATQPSDNLLMASPTTTLSPSNAPHFTLPNLTIGLPQYFLVTEKKTSQQFDILRDNPLIIHRNNHIGNTTTIGNSDDRQTAFRIAFIAEGGLVIVINLLLVLFLIRIMTRLKSKHVAKCFINLQAAHIMFGVLLIVGQFVYGRVFAVCIISIVVQSFLSMLLKVVDRYLIIRLPYEYKRVRTKHLMCFICGTWVITIAFTFCMLFIDERTDDRTFTLILTIAISVSMFVLVVFNLSVYFIARRHSLVIHRSKKGNKKTDEERQGQKQHLRMRKNKPLVSWKPLFTCVAIVISFCVLWLPYLVHNAMVLGYIHHAERGELFSEVVLIVASLNSLADPLIFVWFNRDLKHEIVGAFRRNSTRSSRRLPTSYGSRPEALLNVQHNC